MTKLCLVLIFAAGLAGVAVPHSCAGRAAHAGSLLQATHRLAAHRAQDIPFTIIEAAYINLDRSPARRQHMESMMANWSIPHRRFPAFPDARSVDVLNYSNPTFSSFLNQGIQPWIITDMVNNTQEAVDIAVEMSHVFLIESFLPQSQKQPNGAFLVMEDDAFCPDDLQSKLDSLAADLPTDWDILRIGWRPTMTAEDGSPQHVFLNNSIDSEVFFVSNCGACDNVTIWGATAYIVRARSVNRVLAHMRHLPLDLVDLTPLESAWDLNVYASKDPICHEVQGIEETYVHHWS